MNVKQSDYRDTGPGGPGDIPRAASWLTPLHPGRTISFDYTLYSSEPWTTGYPASSQTRALEHKAEKKTAGRFTTMQ